MPDILQLKDFILNRLHVDWQASTKPVEYVEISQGDPLLDYEVGRHSEARHSLALRLRVTLTPKKGEAGYIIEAEILGLFEFPETMEEEQIQHLVRVNGGTILYGILRGQIASFTGSFPGGKYILPAIYMLDVVKQVEARRARAQKRAAAKAKAPAKSKDTKKKTTARKADTKRRKP